MIRVGALTTILAIAASACATISAPPVHNRDYFDPALLTDGYSCGGSKVVFSALDYLEVDWFGGTLSAAREPSLYQDSLLPDHASSYRFTWLRSFHSPVIVRIDEMPAGELLLTAKRLSGKGGYGPGRIVATVRRDLTVEETASLRRLLENGELAAQLPVGCNIGIDGAQWIVETNINGSYHFVNRWGGSAPSVREFGLLLLSFTGWDNEPLY